MAKLQYNDIIQKKTVVMDGDPYVVLSSQISKKDRQKASNQTKLKNLRTGSVTDKTFHQADSLEEAEIEKRNITYLYNNKGAYWFCELNSPKDRFNLSEDLVGPAGKYMKENSTVEALVFNDEIIGVSTPIKVELRVTEAAPAVKGNTAQGGNKEVTLETGAVVLVPMFINEGDVIKVNTETNTYAERVEKA